MIIMLIIIHSFVQVLWQLQGFFMSIPLSHNTLNEMAHLMLIIENLILLVGR